MDWVWSTNKPDRPINVNGERVKAVTAGRKGVEGAQGKQKNGLYFLQWF